MNKITAGNNAHVIMSASLRHDACTRPLHVIREQPSKHVCQTVKEIFPKRLRIGKKTENCTRLTRRIIVFEYVGKSPSQKPFARWIELPKLVWPKTLGKYASEKHSFKALLLGSDECLNEKASPSWQNENMINLIIKLSNYKRTNK